MFCAVINEYTNDEIEIQKCLICFKMNSKNWRKTVESHSEKQDTKLQILFYKLVNDDLKNEPWFQETTLIAYI